LRLSDLIDGSLKPGVAPPALLAASRDPDISGLTADSREVATGWLFAALPGAKLDGRDFIDQAVEAGAAAVLSLADAEERIAGRVPLVADAEPRSLLARMAAAFHGAQPDTVVAVTGTNGKTSVAEFARQIWAALGKKAASIGTLGVVENAGPVGPSLTTPDPVRLHKTLADLAGRGVKCAALEASSHGLAQARLDGVRVAAAAFTNLTRDHLDYHGTMEAYRDAKLRLFTRVMDAEGAAVLNADSEFFASFAAAARERGQRVVAYGVAPNALLRLAGRRPTPNGQDLDLIIGGTEISVHLPLVGDFQAWNALAAVGLAYATGASAGEATRALPRIAGVRGRMERVGTLPNGATVYVDYAHTPDALETVLRAARPHVEGDLWCVFGCGGDRDPGKRPMMAERVAAFSDKPVLSDDNPRSEDPAEIRHQAMQGAPGIEEIGGRAEAIHRTIERLGAGDVLIVAGKGHEQGQEISGVMHPFDDASVAREALAAVAGHRAGVYGAGPQAGGSA